MAADYRVGADKAPDDQRWSDHPDGGLRLDRLGPPNSGSPGPLATDDVKWLQGHLGDLIALEFSGLEKVPENNSVTYIQGEVNHVGRFEVVAYFKANRSSSPIRPSNSAIFRSLSRAATMANSAASEWA